MTLRKGRKNFSTRLSSPRPRAVQSCDLQTPRSSHSCPEDENNVRQHTRVSGTQSKDIPVLLILNFQVTQVNKIPFLF